MNISDLVNIMDAKFSKGLSEKTGWGRNEIKTLFDRVMRDSLAEYIDDQDLENKRRKAEEEDDHYRNMVDGPGDFRDGKL